MTEPTTSKPPKMISSRWLAQKRRTLAVSAPGTECYRDLEQEIAAGEAELERWNSFEAAARTLGWKVNQYPGKLADGRRLEEGQGFYREVNGQREFATRQQVWDALQS